MSARTRTKQGAKAQNTSRSGCAHYDLLSRDDIVKSILQALNTGEHASITGSVGSIPSLVAAAINRSLSKPVVLVVAHLDEADEIVEEIDSLGIEGLYAVSFPALEALPGESATASDLFAQRLAFAADLAHGAPPPPITVCPIHALMQGMPRVNTIESLITTIGGDNTPAPDQITAWLADAGYTRVDAVEEPGDFAVRGGILDIYPYASRSQAKGDPRLVSATEPVPIRLDYFGDDLDAMHEIDLDTMGSDRKLDVVQFIASPSRIEGGKAIGSTPPLDLMPQGAIALLVETNETIEQGRGYFERVTRGEGISGPPSVLATLQKRFHAFAEINALPANAKDVPNLKHYELPASPLPEFDRQIATAAAELGEHAARARTLVLCTNETERNKLLTTLERHTPPEQLIRIETAVGYLHRGFTWEAPGSTRHIIIPEHELTHRFHSRRRTKLRTQTNSSPTASREAFLDIEPGDYVVHADHGIARFVGLTSLAPKALKQTATEEAEARIKAASGLNAKQRRELQRKAQGKGPAAQNLEEFLTLEFASRTKLHVPAAQVDKVQRYIGGGHSSKPTLSTLGGKRWQTQKDQVREAVKDLAAELLRVQVAREASPGVRYPSDTDWQRDFEAQFPFDETEDQLTALAAIKQDMSSPRPMDRLLCGDVGYGKTEVAIRAAFKCVEYGKQVAVLVPTTILAEQHERTFRARFKDYPFRVEALSRFKTKMQQNKTIERASRGEVDVLIGTHRLLSKDVRFNDLGLVIVDEEQKFGVEHKHRLLQLRTTVDVLTLSATPIPRTLHMSMLGLRDISSLTTAPLDRRAVVTEVLPYNTTRIKRAIDRELSRDGQVFFVHNRVHNIKSVADDIRRHAPDARIGIGHGQMPDGELEAVMHDFIDRKIDILVSTTIIETGIDVPSANTMFINDAHMFGLADLHQLRGRVGRYKHRAYCYLLLPESRPVADIARKRLKAIEEYSMLGAGFKIAMRDLEIRGAGNLLGAEQSGHIASVGYDMYCRLLEESSNELRKSPEQASAPRAFSPTEVTAEIGALGVLPKPYIPSDHRRLEAYRRIAAALSPSDVDTVEEDLRQAYGEPPAAAHRFLDLARTRVAAARLGVRSIARHDQDVVIRTTNPQAVAEAFEGAQGTLRTLSSKAPPSRGVPGEQTASLHEVYYRPPASYLEPTTLLTILRRRFCGETAPNP